MGENNSSLTRVAPFGRHILENPNDVDMVLQMIGCKEKFGAFNKTSVFFSNGEERRKEISLYQSKDYLKSIAVAIDTIPSIKRHFLDMVNKSRDVSTTTIENRLKFAYGEISVNDVIKGIEKYKKHWEILEGPSHPDLFIESDTALLLVEGKLTEACTTKSVSFVPSRNQMLRHIQGAIEYNRLREQNKQIYAIYIVGKDFKEFTNLNCKDYISNVIENESIKLNDPEEKELIQNSYWGCISWEDISEKIGIEFAEVKKRKQ